MKALVTILSCLGLLLACLCCSHHRHQATDEATSASVELAVLAHMVTNAARSSEAVRFVQLTPVRLGQLRSRCGQGFRIEGEGASRPPTSGTLLLVRWVKHDGLWAEARVSYRGCDGSSDFLYKLRQEHGEWHILSCEFVCAT